ncbi:MAG: superoxide dismutase family protein [Clostridiales bacterium]|nr:superoxide dismutase family protein [Clostridiales bacterium]
MEMVPEAYAHLKGNQNYPALRGNVYFYPIWEGTLVAADFQNLPSDEEACQYEILGFHIHEGSQCLPEGTDPFGKTKAHFNPHGCEHPYHAGDLPPIFANHGRAFSIFYMDRFYPDEIAGRTLVLHKMSDDFHTQPSGNSGEKIGCGEIRLTHRPSSPQREY